MSHYYFSLLINFLSFISPVSMTKLTPKHYFHTKQTRIYPPVWQHTDEAEVDTLHSDTDTWLMESDPRDRPLKRERTDTYQTARKSTLPSEHTVCTLQKQSETLMLIWTANEICFPGHPSGMLHAVSLFSSLCRPVSLRHQRDQMSGYSSRTVSKERGEK